MVRPIGTRGNFILYLPPIAGFQPVMLIVAIENFRGIFRKILLTRAESLVS
jgi:hypothetical protein